MKISIKRLSLRTICFGISACISVLICVILVIVGNHLANAQSSQRIAERWSEKNNVSQISCFFAWNREVTEETIEEFEHNLDTALVEASITSESENAGARLWVDAYSSCGKIALESDKGTITVNAIGIGGDFFQFHPLELIGGSFFSGNDVLSDYIVLDEDAAWQLFGSNDIAGQIVTIKGVPHIVTGVIKRETGRLAEAAGLDQSVAYVSHSTLEAYGTSSGINHFEIVMPNPVSGYALGYVKEKFGTDTTTVEIVENSTRYSLLHRLQLIGQFGTRSMNGKAIIYPYWENIARGYEDLIAIVFLFQLLFLIYPIIVIVIYLIFWWKGRNWTMKDVINKLSDKWERHWEAVRAKRARRKGENYEE